MSVSAGMIELTEFEASEVNGGINWGAVGAGLVAIGASIAGIAKEAPLPPQAKLAVGATGLVVAGIGAIIVFAS